MTTKNKVLWITLPIIYFMGMGFYAAVVERSTGHRAEEKCLARYESALSQGYDYPREWCRDDAEMVATLEALFWPIGVVVRVGATAAEGFKR